MQQILHLNLVEQRRRVLKLMSPVVTTQLGRPSIASIPISGEAPAAQSPLTVAQRGARRARSVDVTGGRNRLPATSPRHTLWQMLRCDGGT